MLGKIDKIDHNDKHRLVIYVYANMLIFMLIRNICSQLICI